ncbi:probable serine/threonine-protein kinase PBL21, partial [Phalaenopsis equestris]|uniref:probable serine/threonine-protein kinase PBL21 n=1 Tax=Phalaenopsis equestris TaxID=78828 RepID=UPI0009E62B13
PPPEGGSRLRRWRRQRAVDGSGLENKSWLLAETEGEPSVAEPHSVNSSFRFSFGSHEEAELDATPATAATVLLLVSLEDERDATAEKREHDPALLVTRDWQLWRSLESVERSIGPVAGGLVRFSYAQIRSATQDFHKGRELGRGALSRVYKGRISNGLRRPAVAIKRVDGSERERAKAFCRELLIASSLSSPHVVPLLGYCIEKEGLFLVYKYISGGSLDHHLHQNGKRRKVLPWEVRYKVAVCLARAVEYLHFCTDKCVVHRDIKPSNILLSSKKRPMLCDFGLATWTHGPSLPFLCKAVKGTFGYLAPEYFQNGKLSDKTDVYAFGVVLLELITGRKALDQNRPQGDENLVVWAKPLLLQGDDAIEKLVDPSLIPWSYRRREMFQMVRAANACLSCEDSTRPSIDLVLAMLLGEEGTACSEWSLFSSNGCLTGYGSQFHEARERSDMGGHLALAMLGISDNEEDDTYGR